MRRGCHQQQRQQRREGHVAEHSTAGCWPLPVDREGGRILPSAAKSPRSGFTCQTRFRAALQLCVYLCFSEAMHKTDSLISCPWDFPVLAQISRLVFRQAGRAGLMDLENLATDTRYSGAVKPPSPPDPTVSLDSRAGYYCPSPVRAAAQARERECSL